MKKVQADVIVVAAGPAGLAAAVSAAENGASVIVFEKSPNTGGTGNMGMGPLGVGTRLQKMSLVGLTWEEAFDKFMNYTHWRSDARLVRNYLARSADTIEWLQDMGVEFFSVQKYFPGSEQTWHIAKPESGMPGPRAATSLYKRMYERAVDLGAQFYLETPVKKLIKAADGTICGVIATDKNGEEVEGTAKAVIVASGGFGDNTKMIEEETGMKWGEDLFSFRIPGLMGDGIRMVREVGGAPTSVGMEVIYCMPQTTDQLPGVARVFSQPNLMVNLDGERFINEDIMENTTFTGNAIMLQKKRCGFTIIDSSIIKQYRRKGIDVISLVHPTFDIGDFEGDVERALAAGNTDIFVADTLEELAEKTGINCEALLTTVEEYNDMCESGDTLFNKPKKYMRAIKKGPYYAGRFFPSAYGTLGGFKVNYKLEVENTSGGVIKGLYGAGTDVCTIYGDSYVFILPGNTMGFCINSGRMAGENAAAFVQGN